MLQDVTRNGTYVAPSAGLTTVADGADDVYECATECRVLMIANHSAARLYYDFNCDTITVTAGRAKWLESGEAKEIGCVSFTKVCVHPVGAAAVFSGGTPSCYLSAY